MEPVNNLCLSLLDVLQKWATEAPDAVAIEAEGEVYSYSQLDQLSTAVASSLQKKGVKPGDAVAMYMPRVKEIWPVIFGIFKAGAIYLPLEPAWPSSRINTILSRAACGYVVVSELTNSLGDACQLLSAELFTDKQPLLETAAISNTAYIIFTSGSTGEPKGVEVSHQALQHLLAVMGEVLNADSSIRQLCITSFAFDLVIPDLFLPLVFGGCCVLADNKDISLLPALLNDKNINPFRKMPLPNWRISYDGLSKIKWVQKYVKTLSFTHAYRSNFNMGSYTTNLGYSEDADGLATELDMAGNFISEKQIMNVAITEQFQPLLGANMTLKNGIKGKLEIKKDRNIALSLSNNQITEIKGNELVIGSGYIFKKLQLPIKFNGKKIDPSDLNLDLSISIRDNKTITRKIIENQNQAGTIA